MTITNYAQGLRAGIKRLLTAGHELGNHMSDEDQYDGLDEVAFEAALLKARGAIATLTGGAPPTPWFRAPSGCQVQRGDGNDACQAHHAKHHMVLLRV
eukprot:1812608-Prymnesium_polylepis.1